MRVFSLAAMILLCFNSLAVNTPPSLNTSQTTVSTSLCSGESGEIPLFAPLQITDVDGDLISIISYSSSNQSVLPNNAFYAGSPSTPGELTTYLYTQIGTPVAGTCVVTLQVTDGTDTVSIVLPTITVNQAPVLTFVPNPKICMAEGTVDMNQFVSPQGGEFSNDGIIYEEGFFNPTEEGYGPGDQAYVSYSYSQNGCMVNDGFYINIFESPSINIATTPTSCAAATGTAIATVTGGAPTLTQSWSTGITGIPNISSLGTGQYMYYHVDTNHCATSASFSIDPAGVSINETVTNVACHSQSNGAITITQTGLTTPVVYVWTTGHTGTAVTGLAAGTYTVYATDANNCMISKAITITQPGKLTVDAGVNLYPSCGESDGETAVWTISGGIEPYITTWSNGTTGDINSGIAFGIHTVTVKDANNCIMAKPIYLSESGGADISGTVIPANCGTNDGKIEVDLWSWPDTVQFITWSNGATTEDLLNVAPANYVCTTQVANSGCRSLKGWNIPVAKPLRQDICVITVDSLTTTNLIVWEKSQPIGVAYYNIYRETSTQGEYIQIDTVWADNISLFNDVIASPSERSWSYKMSAVNTCGAESPLSLAHRTIHLDLLDLGSGFVKVNWNAYEGTTAFTDYIVWRYTDADGWEEAGTVPSTTLSFTDPVDYSTPGLDYMVEFELTIPCSAEKAQDFNTVRSNRERGQFAPGEGVEGASSNSISENYLNSVQLYPNPTSDKITFVQEGNEQITYSILSLSGQVMQTSQSTLTNTVVDMSQLNSGIYLVELKMNDIKITKRVVKL